MTRFELSRNGDTPDTIKAQGLAIKHAAEALEKALADAMPHGRNYQPLPSFDTSWQKDRADNIELRRVVHNIGLTGYDIAMRAHNQGEDMG